MTRFSPFRNHPRTVLTAIVAALLIALTQLQASAASTVTAVVGTGYGYRAYNIVLLGGAQSDTGPTPTATLASDASNSPQSAFAPTGLVEYGPAVLFTSDDIAVTTWGSLGTSGSANTSTSVSNINKATTQPGTGSEIFTADNVSGSCEATLSGTSGSTSITNGTLRTDSGLDLNHDGDYTDAGEHAPVTVSVPTNPAPNTTYTGHIHLSSTTQDDWKLVFNEQVVNADGSLTVNPVHEYFLGPSLTGDLIIGRAVCGVTAT